MASGHVNRTNRPNTWLHRPSLRREDSPCQPGAVHTWHIAAVTVLNKSGNRPCPSTSAQRRWSPAARIRSVVRALGSEAAENVVACARPVGVGPGNAGDDPAMVVVAGHDRVVEPPTAGAHAAQVG